MHTNGKSWLSDSSKDLVFIKISYAFDNAISNTLVISTIFLHGTSLATRTGTEGPLPVGLRFRWIIALPPGIDSA